jgi:predicted nucleic acid-binding protein
LSKQTVVIDTNILLELFVFQDPAVEKLREQMQTHQVLKFRKRAARDGVIITSVYTGQ